MSYSSNGTLPPALFLENDDPKEITRWCKKLGPLLKIPKNRIEVDLEKPKQTKKEQVEDSHRKAGMGWSLNGVTEWTFDNDFKIALKKSEDGLLVFHDPEGNQLHKLTKEDRISEVVGSPGRKVFVFLLPNRDGAGGSLLRVSAPEKQAVFERVFTYSETPLFGKNRWWIRELGAIDDTGQTLLANLGRMPAKGGRVIYEWQTWSIPKERQLGQGLQISNGARKD